MQCTGRVVCRKGSHGSNIFDALSKTMFPVLTAIDTFAVDISLVLGELLVMKVVWVLFLMKLAR